MLVQNSVQIYPTIEYVAMPFNGILLDAYGVFRGGNNSLIAGAKAAMQNLVENGKVVGILSNTTQVNTKEISKLATLGLFEGVHYHFFITSGDVAKGLFKTQSLPFATPQKKFWLFGKEHPRFSSHHILFQESAYVQTEQLEEADFVYISIPHINGEDQEDREVFRDEILRLKKYQLPMVCTNPDRYAHEGSPLRAVVRQGSIAAMHEELGGKVFYIGKPSKLMFAQAMEYFARYKITSVKDVLMVGDTPETDIRGAVSSGMPAALLTRTGIFADKVSVQGLQESIQQLAPDEMPTFFLESLGRL